MKFKPVLIFLSVFFLGVAMSACSGVQPTPEIPPPAEKDFGEKLQDWLQFIGKDQISDDHLRILTEANEGNCCGNIQDLRAYLLVLFMNDPVFANSVDQLKLKNQQFFQDFRCLSEGPGPNLVCDFDINKPFDLFQIETMLRHYNEMTSSANLARTRLIESAAILGFTINPATQSLGAAEGLFVQPINSAISDAAAQDPSLFSGEPVPSVDAALLKAVSLQMDDVSVLSFFNFTLSDSNDIAGPRGSLDVVAVQDNPLIRVINFPTP